jgi:hypothetical protein
MDATYDLKDHINQTILLGRSLLDRAQELLTSGDPDQTGEANKIFSAASAQISSLVKIHSLVLKADRQRTLEATLQECLQEIDPALALKFVNLFEERLGPTELDSP